MPVHSSQVLHTRNPLVNYEGRKHPPPLTSSQQFLSSTSLPHPNNSSPPHPYLIPTTPLLHILTSSQQLLSSTSLCHPNNSSPPHPYVIPTPLFHILMSSQLLSSTSLCHPNSSLPHPYVIPTTPLLHILTSVITLCFLLMLSRCINGSTALAHTHTHTHTHIHTHIHTHTHIIIAIVHVQVHTRSGRKCLHGVALHRRSTVHSSTSK